MAISEVEKVVAKQVDEWTSRVLTAREDIAREMRRGQGALAEARIAALALGAIHPGHDYIGQQEKYDGEVRELVAELASLFVDETVKTDDVEVSEASPHTYAAEATIQQAAFEVAARITNTEAGVKFASENDALDHWVAVFRGHVGEQVRIAIQKQEEGL